MRESLSQQTRRVQVLSFFESLALAESRPSSSQANSMSYEAAADAARAKVC